MNWKGMLGATGALVATMLAGAVMVHGQKIVQKRVQVPPPPAADAPKNPEKPDGEKPAIVTLRLYEWGVTTQNWDGTPDTDNDVPAAFYDAKEAPVTGKPQPVDEPPRPPRPPIDDGGMPAPKKPVIYFECDKEVTFGLEVRFSEGLVTWMYPKPTARADASAAQWDYIRLLPDGAEPRDKSALPPLVDLPASHWAALSRQGSTSSIWVNGEHERYLFYEGVQTCLPEVDVFRDAQGMVVVHNHTCQELLDVRLNLPDACLRWARVPAASGEVPGRATEAEARRDGEDSVLAADTAAAGLTAPQAKVFEQVWKPLLREQKGVLSWRRTSAALDELMPIKLTLPAGLASDAKRVGYVAISKVDLARQTEFEALVSKAGDGDNDAATKLISGGVAGAGALRRALADEKLPLARRLALARVLAHLTER